LHHHKIVAEVEDCGVEIRDCIMFLGSPSYMIALGRTPLDGNVAQNVLRYGTGSLNIDSCRVGTEVVSTHSRGKNSAFPKRPGEKSVEESGRRKDQREGLSHQERSGRWPANVILSSSPEVLGKFPESKGQQGAVTGKEPSAKTDVAYGEYASRKPFEIRGDTGSSARFFYQVEGENSLKGIVDYLMKLVNPGDGKVLFLGFGGKDD